MSAKVYNSDVSVILRASQNAGGGGVITPEMALRLAKGFRSVLKLSPNDRLVLLDRETSPAQDRSSHRNNHKEKRSERKHRANQKKRKT